ncbi:uncharacterized protein LOC121593171 [Anopheles merus]|uniref:uncharacterized protein LOC121593171 n=1 Tax=Anopheles merus TaxID=30066 RepID=UPI001BE45B45|nr:uncharacterized protein LOC121593171 [Anopheles merus]
MQPTSKHQSVPFATLANCSSQLNCKTTNSNRIKMNKIICLLVVLAVAGCAWAKPEPKPDLLAYNVAGVPVVAAAAPAVASYATVYEQTFHGNLAPAAYVAYSAYDPYLSAVPVPVAAPVLLRK